jgi:hypothetical protein
MHTARRCQASKTICFREETECTALKRNADADKRVLLKSKLMCAFVLSTTTRGNGTVCFTGRNVEKNTFKKKT